ncbi:beta-hexosaminidase subunit beta-like [Condylostylus longicornis]|uniref:beta-hexosaminidase subunit beta-like n=1 Tax=Condylostylus longicornis TaxID=2530218 RepID=UPI00244DB274|nr:beta-hexosaminidase subunit beta-like [Condylostylus longicornis]XP_055372165.1 beta-hexosaminidase subunit beta-like [Condylostylus longicornis]XP_055372166.1 beta-hexosaminidase subunit beta-like [Condylostylus longicornis]XP_055372167.1 beta-hexosaminidase subunit beta-like [Condylostylus longicornis]
MMKSIAITLLLLIAFENNTSFGYIIDPGPQIKATNGEVWPRPKFEQKTPKYFVIDPDNFDFSVIGRTCDILEDAVVRYKNIIKNTVKSILRSTLTNYHYHNKPITQITINLTSPCEFMPNLTMDEWYYLSGSGNILAHSIWGILRGLETYSQLITPANNGLLKIRDVRIRDSPRYPHRGLLLDTSRHFMEMKTIYDVLDGMAYNKLNVFHWHIVDDHSFPYQSIKYPELSEKGAYLPDMVYSQNDVASVIEYARLRGIRVIAEFDVPGHTRSWGNSHPELLTECGEPYKGKLGPLDPISEESYKFMENFIEEIVQVFPDKYMHLGGDEVGFECWDSNSTIRNYTKANNLTYTHLQKKFMEKVTRMATNNSVNPIVWQEAMVENVNMPEGTVVQVWLGDWRKLFSEFTNAGHHVLLSECWYLDHLSTGGDWLKYYRCEPENFNGTNEQKKLVLGGEACMWSEVVNNNNVVQRIFPRVSATAERLWSQEFIRDEIDAKRRLEEHTCRMILRGIPAQPPTGPGIC